MRRCRSRREGDSVGVETLSRNIVTPYSEFVRGSCTVRKAMKCIKCKAYSEKKLNFKPSENQLNYSDVLMFLEIIHNIIA